MAVADRPHARKAAEILDARSILQGHGLSNAMLQAGWTGGRDPGGVVRQPLVGWRPGAKFDVRGRALPAVLEVPGP